LKNAGIAFDIKLKLLFLLMNDMITTLNVYYRFLAQQTDLSPSNPAVLEKIQEIENLLKNCVILGEFDDIPRTKETLDLRINLPRIYAIAKCELEKDYARRFLDGGSGMTELSKFTYYTNYIRLIQEEFALLPFIPSRVIFLGCGALPLTAILIAKSYDEAEVLCVDSDSEACDFADCVIKRVGMHNNVKIYNSSASDFFSENGEAVISAALLSGCNVFELPVVKNSSFILFRHGRGVISILYDNISKPDDNFRLMGSTSSNNVNINTTSVYMNLRGDKS
jgi:hypothetical protein